MDSLHTSLVDDGGPMIPRTKSLYELPKRGSVDYRFRNTVAFWIAVSFVEGSLLFMCGAIASIVEVDDDWMRRALVEYAYFAGSIFFTIGAYLGFFEVINLGRVRVRLFGFSGTSVEAYWGSLLYFLGALCFNVSCSEGLLPSKSQSRGVFWAVYWTPSTLGSACFVLAALIEFKHNSHVRCSTPVFWLCFWYLLGALLFLLASIAGWPHQALEDALVNVPYLLGSLAFALGAWCALWMWKAEQFGLGFIREINEVHENHQPAGHGSGESPYLEYERASASQPAAMLEAGASGLGGAGAAGAGAAGAAGADAGAGAGADASAGAGAGAGAGGVGGLAAADEGGAPPARKQGVTPGWNPGAVDLKQQAFLLVYVLLGTLSVLDLCNGVAYNLEVGARRAYAQERPVLGCERVLSSLCDFLAAHTILMLATIVHRTPSLHPYDYLLWCMRLIALLYLASEITRFAAYANLYPHIVGAPGPAAPPPPAPAAAPSEL